MRISPAGGEEEGKLRRKNECDCPREKGERRGERVYRLARRVRERKEGRRKSRWEQGLS